MEIPITVTIERLALGGEGIARHEGKVFFVPYTAPGDVAEVEITESKPRFARARLIRIVSPSPDRVAPPCPYHFAPHLYPLPQGERNSLNSSSPHRGRGPAHEQPSFDMGRPCKRWTGEGVWCGGCSWQHLRYEAQLRAKQHLVQETLERIGKLRGTRVLPTLGMPEPWHYRNKVQHPVALVNGRLATGFYAPASHELVPIEDCLVQPALSVRLVNRTRQLLVEDRYPPYQEDTHSGWIRHLLVRVTGEHLHEPQALLTFVTRTPEFRYESRIVQALITEFPELRGLFQNVNPVRGNVILGSRWRKLWGDDTLEEKLGDLIFQISPGSFFQVNTMQTEVLYNAVRRYATPPHPAPSTPYGACPCHRKVVHGRALSHGGERNEFLNSSPLVGEPACRSGRDKGEGEMLLDLYCGSGGIALWLARSFQRVVGIEENASAIKDAQANAKRNGIANCQFLCARVEKELRDMGPPPSPVHPLRGPPRSIGGCSWAGPPPRGGRAWVGVVVLDPPRSGCSEPVLRGIARLSPDRIIYVSCDAGTLARDLAILSRGSYTVVETQPVDLFPHTPHIETVTFLRRAA